MKITDSNNFCRVFELPEQYPEGYCFGGGHYVDFKMVDWFQPLPREALLGKNIMPWSEYVCVVKSFLKGKDYVKPNRKYLLITDFGESFVFEKWGVNNNEMV